MFQKRCLVCDAANASSSRASPPGLPAASLLPRATYLRATRGRCNEGDLSAGQGLHTGHTCGQPRPCRPGSGSLPAGSVPRAKWARKSDGEETAELVTQEVPEAAPPRAVSEGATCLPKPTSAWPAPASPLLRPPTTFSCPPFGPKVGDCKSLNTGPAEASDRPEWTEKSAAGWLQGKARSLRSAWAAFPPLAFPGGPRRSWMVAQSHRTCRRCYKTT